MLMLLAGCDRIMQAQLVTVCTFLLTVPKVPRNSAFVGSRSTAAESAPEGSAACLSLLCGRGVALLAI